MNKKGGIIGTAAVLIIAALLVWFLLIPVIGLTIKDYKDYHEYKEFCEDREDFCYCEMGECTFKLRWEDERPTRDTRAYCRLAEELEDEKGLFDGDCK